MIGLISLSINNGDEENNLIKELIMHIGSSDNPKESVLRFC